MSLREMFKKTTYISVNRPDEKETETNEPETEVNVPEGLFMLCSHCGEMVYTEDVIENNYICVKCNRYFRIDAATRLNMVVDEGTFTEWDTDIENSNPLDFPNYKERISLLKKKTKIDEAVVTGVGKINGETAVIGICDTRFLMGSMGYVVGEKVTRAVEKATEMNLPVIIFTCSGGARMQEGIVSLMQMAKTSEALKKHSESGNLYISVLTDPTTGGVTASFAMLGDIILAEPGALVGFAGPRVIKQTIGEELPDGFQRSEFLLKHGLIDNIVERKDLKDTLYRLVKFHKKPKNKNFDSVKERLSKVKFAKNSTEMNSLQVWDKVQVARSTKRPTALDFINNIFTGFYELHGDRNFKDDGAIVGGLAYFYDIPVTVIGQQKGRTTKENIERNFGMPNPEGYRKALRLMKEAEQFNRPVICFVDTPGAFCGIEAEERGQGEAIARNLYEMSALKVPVLSVVIGEGGSGGALAMAVANEVWMMENSTYSILSPEGFASIMWKDAKRAKEAAEVMRITAKDLLELKIIEKIIPENPVASQENIREISYYFKKNIVEFLQKYENMSLEDIRNERYKRFRNM